ncbi:hypothetical protein OIU79_003295 [Salix purpurea]|uniref:Uncharacterized protein n=1 Tax=Salix purpurea TaxID=77065 RepID=A0A9Q0ULM7_SALPP|nr:hypothetical protein OIU79_003295 [Salix purpurea]
MDRLQAPAALPPPSHPHRTQIPNTSSPFLIQTSSLIDDSWLSTVDFNFLIQTSFLIYDSWLSTVDFNFSKREQGFGCFIEKT